MRRLFLATLLMLIGASPAWAQCAPGVPCAGNPMGIPPDRDNSPYAMPQDTDQGQRPAPGDAPSSYGAFAVNHKGQVGWSYGERSEKSAARSAMASCTALRTDGCQIIDTFSDTCGAPSADAASNLYMAYAEQARTAQQFAVEKCLRDSHAGSCRLLGRAICSGAGYSASYMREASDRASATTPAELEKLSAGYRPHR